MKNVGIITDSIHGLTPELIKQYDIRVAPMGISINNKGYRDMVDIQPEDIYKLFPLMKTPGTTSAASPGDFLRHYEDLAKTSRGILYIGVSKILSATYNIATQTRGMFLSGHPAMRIELLDSKTCMGAVGFLAIEAARASNAGKDLDEVIALLQGLLPRLKYISVLNTLENLVKIGRMPASVLSSHTLDLRPIIGMNDNSGNIQNLPPVPKSQALEKALEVAGKLVQPDKPTHVIFHYSQNRPEADEMKRLFTGKYNCCEVYMSEYSPAALCGTGLMTGMAFYQ